MEKNGFWLVISQRTVLININTFASTKTKNKQQNTKPNKNKQTKKPNQKKKSLQTQSDYIYKPEHLNSQYINPTVISLFPK